MSATTAPPRPVAVSPARGAFGAVLRAEWTKFRTVRGWLISLVMAALLCVVFTFLVANGNHEDTCTGVGVCQTGHPFVPTGPAGEAVADSYQYLSRPLTGDGIITTQLSSFTGLIYNGPANIAPSLAHTRPGLAGWAKAGLLLTPTTKQGAPYAAVMTTGSHGTRFQDDYNHDQPGLPGTVTGSSPRWLRLTRAGDTITGYGSTNGSSWHRIAATRLSGLPAAVKLGLFVTSPVSFNTSGSGVPTQATATFDHVTATGTVTGAWQSRAVGMTAQGYYPTLGTGVTHRSGDTFTLAGSGDMAPAVNPLAGGNTVADSLWFGFLVALIVLVVVAVMFITVEYRRGLIRTTLTATPQRSAVLAAKAIVIAADAFVVGAVAAAIGIPLGLHVLNGNGNYVYPASTLTKVQVIAGGGALLALSAVAALAVGTILRRSAGAIAAGIVVVVLPYIISSYSSGSIGTWLFRLTPAAGLSVLGVLPRSPLVDAPYSIGNDYYPLPPWAGLLVLAAYTAVALAAARFLLARRDA